MRDTDQAYERLEWMCAHLGYGKAALTEYKEKFNKTDNEYYIDRRKALALMKEKISQDAEEWKTDLVERLEHMYEFNVRIASNQNVALNVLQTLAKLSGLLEDKVKVESSSNYTIKWDKETEE